MPLLTVGGSVPFGPDHGDYSLGTRYTVPGTNTHGGPAGILRPGQRETVTFYGYSDTEPGDYTVFVDREIKDPVEAFDWEAAMSAVQPAPMSAEDAAAMATFLAQTYGSNAGGYLEMLSEAANATWEDARNQDGLLQEEVLRAWSRLASGIWGVIESSEVHPEGGFVVIATESTAGKPFVTRTDRLGRFHLPNLPDGSYQLSIKHHVITTPGGGFVELLNGQSVGPLALSIEAAPTVTLQID